MILAVFSARNEGFHLPFFLPHLAGWVDGFVALDDGSTDDTERILSREPKMLDILSNPKREDDGIVRERANRERLLRRAKALGARWVLCLDPDERLETRVLAKLVDVRARAERHGKPLVAFRLRELWDSPLHYRIDGLWGRKERVRFFEVPESITYEGVALHAPWYPDAHAGAGKTLRVPGNIYHLKMIRGRDRERRRRLYNELDPERRWQSVGYDYLTDEAGLTLNRIPPWRSYSASSIPPELRELRPKRSALDAARSEARRGLDAVRGIVRAARG